MRWPCAFVAKAVLDLPTTGMLIERLAVDADAAPAVRLQCAGAVPNEATFSRAFAGLAEREVPQRVHETLIKRTLGTQLVGHISRDATAIEAREKPARREKPQDDKAKRKPGRPKKGEVVPPKEPRRLERQSSMSLAEMLADLPTCCSVGTKRNAKGHTTSWIGYKLHIDTADGEIPRSLHPDRGLGARQSGGAAAGNPHGGPRHQSLRPDGQCLRCARIAAYSRALAACADHRSQDAARREGRGRGGRPAPSERRAACWRRMCATASAAPPSASMPT